ncbi:hypothetical protein EQ826_05395 [Ectopseudomonas mendocina]|nr:hypothetical protein EQ828_08675 [Pseudomonas mendocina]TRO28216.1 hypothetical protein EQ826_05395 [Pseudomonas mendocina]
MPWPAVRQRTNRPLKSVGEAGKTRQKQPKKRSLRVVNEHFDRTRARGCFKRSIANAGSFSTAC